MVSETVAECRPWQATQGAEVPTWVGHEIRVPLGGGPFYAESVALRDPVCCDSKTLTSKCFLSTYHMLGDLCPAFRRYTLFHNCAVLCLRILWLGRTVWVLFLTLT